MLVVVMLQRLQWSGGRRMTPRFRGVTQALSKLQHDLDYDADKLMRRIADADTRRERAFAKSHGAVDAASNTLAEIEEFVSDLERTNAGPLEDAPRSSDIMSER
jgi:hypothetical protein